MFFCRIKNSASNYKNFKFMCVTQSENKYMDMGFIQIKDG